MLFNWQNKCTEQVGENDLSTKNATRRSTQPRPMPGYHETLRQMPGNVHHTESILLGSVGNVKNKCIKTTHYDKNYTGCTEPKEVYGANLFFAYYS